MSGAGLCFLVGMHLAALAGITGEVRDPSGQPLAGAHVFIEQGLDGAVEHSVSGPDGAFRFDGVPFGRVGLFATAEGFGFAGRSLTLKASETETRALVQLAVPGRLTGTVKDGEGKPVAGARIGRVAVLGETPVSIPFEKMGEFGWRTPETDAKGGFQIEGLPAGGDVALKVTHPSFATEGVPKAPVGGPAVEVVMQPGVLVRGTVVTRKDKIPVAGATVHIRNSAPPGDTTVTTTQLTGEFTVRLKPGAYGMQAEALDMRSPGWEALPVTGEIEPRVTVYVSELVALEGDVRDAETRQPIPGARLSLSTYGNPAAVAESDAEGRYSFRASAGDNTVRLESAAGYLLPDKPGLEVLAKEEKVVLPTYWLVRLGDCRVKLLGEGGEPVGHAVVTALRPRQFGWWIADGDGIVAMRFQSAPQDGVVVGLAEHPAKGLCAAFSARMAGGAQYDAQLLPYAGIRGRVVNDKEKPVEGATVSLVFAEGPDSTPITVWQTVSRKDGSFAWAFTPAGARLRCVAVDAVGATGASEPFTPQAGETLDIGAVIIAGAAQGVSLHGASLGETSGSGVKDIQGPVCVLCCTPVEAPAMAEALVTVKAVLGESGVSCVLVTDGAVSWKNEPPVTVYEGKRPGRASTYLVGSDGHVAMETFGLPPLQALRVLE